ncbi:MAG: hypothetical protein FDW93_05965 [Bergeyella sp.]|nr:hypothetical protein [Bergeyella sp.]
MFIRVYIASVLDYQGWRLHKSNIGIGTKTPQKTLRVNGPYSFTCELNVGGDDRTTGSAGNKEETLISRGPDAASVWKPVVAGRRSKHPCL